MTGLSEKGKAHVLAAIEARCVEEGDCLLWTGAYSRSTQSGARARTPTIGADGRVGSLRRMAYEAYGGTILPKRMIVMKCGSDLCLAYEHMVQRTQSQLMAGKRRSPVAKVNMAKAAQARGKLTWEMVNEIRGSDEGARALALRFGVRQGAVQDARAYRTWRTNGMFTSLMADRRAA